jgi:hypothetical protein
MNEEEKKMDSISMMTQEEEETPPVMTMAFTTTVSISKTSEFEWKLARLPIHFNAVQVIKFETGRVNETYDDDERV